MEANFFITEQTPIAALTVGQFKQLFSDMASAFAPQPVGDDIPDVFGKDVCAQMTGYSLNSINQFICKKKIPYYKHFGKVLFRKADCLPIIHTVPLTCACRKRISDTRFPAVGWAMCVMLMYPLSGEIFGCSTARHLSTRKR